MTAAKKSLWSASAGLILGVLAVVFGAAGSHLFSSLFTPVQMQAYSTAVTYQMYHALFLLSVGLSGMGRDKTIPFSFVACIAAFFGTIFFSGSIYILLFTGFRFFGPVTPIGGLMLISAWVVLFVGVITEIRSGKNKS